MKERKGGIVEKAKIIQFPHGRKKRDEARRRDSLNDGKSGSVYSRNGKLWVYFRYLGERVREPSGLKDTPGNRRTLRRQLDLIVAEIENGLFEFAKRFPQSSKKDHFTLLEGKTVRKEPEEVLFGEYVKRWWEEMRPGMSLSQVRDYRGILDHRLLPYFGDVQFSEFRPVLMKKFLAHMKGKKNRYGRPLSAKRIHNVMIPLRVITRDAIDEHGWVELHDPFAGLKMPRVKRIRIHPFSFEEWKVLMGHILPWYRPYFEFAVQTGLRPSEQVALKWTAIDEEFIHIELSRVRKEEKSELKTDGSNRRIEIRPSIHKVLEEQKELVARVNSPYVFLNTHGKPVRPEKLGEVWQRAMAKSGLSYRRMYEIRHTFASWALHAGESPEWVARTLGHVNTSMVYKTYGRYIPNLTRQDGSAFERVFSENIPQKERGEHENSHNFSHNGIFSGHSPELTT